MTGLLTVKEVAHLLRLSVRAVWKLRSAGHMPPPVRLGGRSIRWRAADVERFIECGCDMAAFDGHTKEEGNGGA